MTVEIRQAVVEGDAQLAIEQLVALPLLKHLGSVSPGRTIAGDTHGRHQGQPTVHGRLQLAGDLARGRRERRSRKRRIRQRPASAGLLVGQTAHESQRRRQRQGEPALVHNALELLLDPEKHREGSRRAGRLQPRSHPRFHFPIGKRQAAGLTHNRPGTESSHEGHPSRIPVGAQTQLLLIERLFHRSGDHGALRGVQVQARNASAPVGVHRHRPSSRGFHEGALGRADAILLLHALEHATVGGHECSFLDSPRYPASDWPAIPCSRLAREVPIPRRPVPTIRGLPENCLKQPIPFRLPSGGPLQ